MTKLKLAVPRLTIQGPNATVLAYDHPPGPVRILYSYSTPVAISTPFGGYRSTQFHSNTTSRHINSFFNAERGIDVEKVTPDRFNELLETPIF